MTHIKVTEDPALQGSSAAGATQPPGPEQLREALADVKNYAAESEAGRDEIRAEYYAGIETIEAALSELAELRAASQWRPIETAPKTNVGIRDGRWILGCSIKGDAPYPHFIMRSSFTPDDQFKTVASGACWEQKGFDWPCYPTHWMPLPTPPKEAGND